MENTALYESASTSNFSVAARGNRNVADNDRMHMFQSARTGN